MGTPRSLKTEAGDVARKVRSTEESDFDEYDIIIAGGGTAGCVLAARLSEDPKVRVLLLEAGGSGRSLLLTRIPIGFSLLFHTKHVYELFTEPQSSAKGKKKFWPRAKMLGGCSSINAEMAQYGAPQDFDEWANIVGDENWSWKNLSRYFKKFEKYVDDPAYPDVKNSLKGSEGPVQIGYFSAISQASKDFIKACTKLGIPYSPDFNVPSGTKGVNRLMTYIDETRTRVSAESAYLTKDVLSRPNLKVVIRATVTRVIVVNDNGDLRATGVEFSKYKGGPTYRVRSRQEVIVAGGAIHSPQILMLSGIGPADELKKVNIPVIHNLQGVGSNLVDHPVVDMYFKDKLNNSPKHVRPQNIFDAFKAAGSAIQYFVTRRGPLTSNYGECAAFIRTDDPVLFPPEEYSKKLAPCTSGADSPDVEIFCTPFAHKDHGDYIFPMHTFSIHACLLRPMSKGSLRLKSSDPWEYPLMDPRYLTAPEDVERLVRGMRLIMRISKAEPLLARLDHTNRDPRLDHQAHTLSDKELEDIVRERVETLYHPVGTCRMAPLEKGGVVNSHLRVHGIKGLRVCDASIFPEIVSGHTAGAVLATAEYLADIIKSRVGHANV